MTAPLSDELLSAYVDGELTQDELAEVEAFLAESPEARKKIDGWKELGKHLRDVPSLNPDSLASRVLKQAERESLLGKPQPAGSPVRDPKKSNPMRLIVSITSVAAVLAIALLLNNQMDQQPESGTASPTEVAGLDDVELRLVEGSEGASSARSSGVPEGESFSFAESPDRIVMDSTMSGLGSVPPFVSPTDLKDARIGDVLSGWKLEDEEVVVVKLTVVDRREIFDSLQIMLSDLDIQNEPPRSDSNTNGRVDDGILALYVNADQPRMETALEELQSNGLVNSIAVSTVIPTKNLDPILVSNGYAVAEADVDVDVQERLKFEEPEIDPAPKPAAVRRAKPAPSDQPEADKEGTKSRRVADNFGLPSPPPLPESSDNLKLSFEGRDMLVRQRAIYVPQQQLSEIELSDEQRTQQKHKPAIVAREGNPVTGKKIAEPAASSEDKPLSTPADSKTMARTRSKNVAARQVNLLFLVVPEMQEAAPAPRE